MPDEARRFLLALFSALAQAERTVLEVREAVEALKRLTAETEGREPAVPQWLADQMRNELKKDSS